MSIIAGADAPQFTLPGVTFVGLASPSRGARENAVWRLIMQPGVRPMPHRLTREEIFVATAGSAVATIGGEPHALRAGDGLVVPAGTEFSLATPAGESFEAVVILPVGGQAMIGGEAPFTPPWAA
jgi:mannose-6-phosphate isomerase-like protein (cupin superfamily)